MKITKIIIATLIFSALAHNGWLAAANDEASNFSKEEMIELIEQFDRETEENDSALLDKILDSGKSTEEKIAQLNEALKTGTNVNAKDLLGYTPLDGAARKGYLEIVKFLVGKGADINAKNRFGVTPLDTAAYNGHFEIVTFLVENGADINAKDDKGWTPLHMAACHGHFAIVTFLVEKGADINAKDNKGYTPLYVAAYYGHLETVKFLVEKGADINAKDNDGYTPLHMAAREDHLEIVTFLVEKGVDINAEDKDGFTAFTHARTPEMKAYLTMAQGFYETVKKPETFDTFAAKHLMREDGSLNRENMENIVNLLHLGNRSFFEKFYAWSKTNDPDSGVKKNDLLLSIALKKGKNQLYWLNQFFGLLAASTKKIGSTLNERFMWAMSKLPQKKRDKIMKIKSEFDQQQKGFLALPQKNSLVIPKHIRMPSVKLTRDATEKAKEKLTDVDIFFKD